MSGVATFIIVSRKDSPIYEAELGTVKKEDSAHLHQFIVHAALDVVDEVVWSTTSSYLKVVDKFNELFVSAYVTAGHTRFMLLHEQKNEEGIKSFFQEVHDLYLKIVLNPLQNENTKLTNTVFDSRVRAIAKRYF